MLDKDNSREYLIKARGGGELIYGGVYIRGGPHYANRKSALKQAIAVGD